MKTLNLVIAAAALAATAATVNATPLISLATNNATIQPAGPRAGASGKNFLNIEGANNNAFASFGVADFGYGSQGGSVSGINSISVMLTEADAAFTRPGMLDFYLSSSSANINPGTSTLVYNPAASPIGIDSQLSALFLLGTGAFNTTSNTATGQLDTYSFVPNAATATYVEGVLNSGGNIRLVIGEDATTPGVAATFAGFSNTNSLTPGPSLSIDVVAAPEPATMSLFGLGALASAFFLRRRRA